jgi:hypothetical protein
MKTLSWNLFNTFLLAFVVAKDYKSITLPPSSFDISLHACVSNTLKFCKVLE